MGDTEGNTSTGSCATEPVVITSPPRIRTTHPRQPSRPTPSSNRGERRLTARNTRNSVSPVASTPTVSRRRRLWQRLVNSDREEEKRALELARRLEYGATLLLEKLFAYLSQLPEEDDDTTTTISHDPLAMATPRSTTTTTTTSPQGMSLPAAAVAWLAGQLYPVPCDEEEEEKRSISKRDTAEDNAAVSLDDAASASCSLVSKYPKGREFSADDQQHQANMGLWLGDGALRDRLSLLRFLLPRVRMIRITRQAWPPELPSESKPSSTRRESESAVTTPPRRHRPPSELNCSTISSVNSALTMEQDLVTGPSPRLAFLEYMHQLQHAPAVDLRVFPRLLVLMLDSVPPSWILNLHTLQPSLQVLRLDRAAVYHLPQLLFSEEQKEQFKQARQDRQHLRDTSTSAIYAPAPKFCALYAKLTHIKLDHCSLGGAASGLPSCLSKLQHVRHLSLQQNEIQDEQMLQGLRAMTNLSHLDLRYNLLPCLPRANLYLGGQLRILKLSQNQISTTRGGLDRCYALRELWLDGNCIRELHQVSGLARLPQLHVLRLHNNPVTTMGDSCYDPGWKVQLWTWFQEERRAVVPVELPVLVDLAGVIRGGGVVLETALPTRREWIQIQDGSFMNIAQPQPIAHIEVTSKVASPSHTIGRTIILQHHESANNADSLLSEIDFHSVQTPSAQSARNGLFSPSSLRSTRTTKKAKTRRAKIRDGNDTSNMGRLRKRQPKISTVDISDGIDKLTERRSTSAIPKIRFSVEDVLFSLQSPNLFQDSKASELEKEEEGSIDRERVGDHESDDSLFPSLHEENQQEIRQEFKARSERERNPFVGVDEVEGEDQVEAPEIEEICQGEEGDVAGPTHILEEDGLNEDVNRRHCDDDESGDKFGEDSYQPSDGSKRHIEDCIAPVVLLSISETQSVEDRIFPDPKPKVGIIKLQKQLPTHTLALMECDWDELIKRASEGQIPDGLVKSPVLNLEHSSSAVTLEMRNGANKVFSDDAVDLLPTDSVEYTADEQADLNQSAASLSATGPLDTTFDTLPNALPDHVWKDDGSALSSLGASFGNNPTIGASKFQIAEENSFYDGPDSCREMKVLENLKLYFEVFVFTESVTTMPQKVLQELEEDHDDWQSVLLYYPRIQLWPDDRRRMEQLVLSASVQGVDLAENREKFRHLWEEEIIPCGKPALRRLPPNRRVRLGFHGDKLFEGPDLDAYSERRNALLCMSTKAFYIILREDAVTQHHKEQAKQRRFPLPIDRDVLFRDAPWPHSVARHSLLDLEAISIGFEFQRLTLRFRNMSFSKSDPFVYVILCSNKKNTVKLLQQLQKGVKDLKESTGMSTSDISQLAIQNDSNLVFDALTEAVVPEPLGTIMHYQILQQCWKHGDRGTVRRTCVLTETNIFLLDEDYTADGHNLSDVTVKVENMAGVKYRKVDEASLKQVVEVQAAGNDPRAITLIIAGLSSLSRTHRWRLVCRDREGAERLVDDVRKAVSNFDELNTSIG